VSDLPILDELGDAVGRASRAAARRARVRLAAGAGAAACVCVVALAVGLAGTTSGPSLAERAFAAVRPAPGVRHLVIDEAIFRRDGRQISQRTEAWLAEDGCRGRTRYLSAGRVRGEITEDVGERRMFDAGRNRIYVSRRERGDLWQSNDPIDAFRDLYRRGRLEETLRVRRDGRDLVQLKLIDGDLTVVYLADARTFVPVSLRHVDDDGRTAFLARFVRYERLRASAASTALLSMPERPGVPVRRLPVHGGGDGPTHMRRLHCYR
jgi:hypothetical protein